MKEKLSKSLPAVAPLSSTLPPTLQTNFTVALVGRARTGKTQICKVLADGVFDDAYTPTTFETYFCSIKDEETVKNFNIFDIGSTEETKNHRTVIYPSCDAILLCFAVDDKESLLHTEEFIKEIRENSGGVEIPVILVGTKIDLREEENHHHLHGRAKTFSAPPSSVSSPPQISVEESDHKEEQHTSTGKLPPLTPATVPPLNFTFVTGVIPKLVDEVVEAGGCDSSRSDSSLVGSARSSGSQTNRDSPYITKTRGVRYSGKIRAHAYMECSAKHATGIDEIVREVITLAEFCQNKKLQQIEKAHVEESTPPVLHTPVLKKRSSSFMGLYQCKTSKEEQDDIKGLFTG